MHRVFAIATAMAVSATILSGPAQAAGCLKALWLAESLATMRAIMGSLVRARLPHRPTLREQAHSQQMNSQLRSRFLAA